MTFTLNDATLGVLGGGTFQDIPFDMVGEFRAIQFHFSQAGSSQDMELHYLEIHYTVGAISKESV